MHAEGDTTRYVDWSPPRARLALALTAVMIGGFMSVVLSAVTFPVHQGKGDTDVDLYRKLVRRIRAGESYYDAYQRVFEEYHYPVRSVLNYRTPLHGWLVGNLPSLFWAQAILAAVVMVTALMAYTCLRRHGGAPRAAAGVLLMLGAFAYCFVNDMYLYTEVWSGTLIALSVCAYELNRRSLGVSAGLLAIFFRELALPYGAISGLIAWRQCRRREAGVWGLGLALYGLHLALHYLAVVPRLPRAGGLINASTWVNYGGLVVILATCRINLLLIASPPWLAALYLPLSLLGMVGWRGETSLRIGALVGLYLAAFSVVGGLNNAYWGLMYAPLLPFGLVWAPASLRDLWSASLRSRSAHRI